MTHNKFDLYEDLINSISDFCCTIENKNNLEKY